jgi:hypothetical protein
MPSGTAPHRRNPTKRRTLNVPETPLMPYRGIPKVTVFN